MPDPNNAWLGQPIAQILAQLGSGPSGLSSQAAATRLAVDGPNLPAAEPPSHRLRHLFKQIAHPLLLVLLGASVAAALAGELTNALVIATMIVLSLVLDAVQAGRAHRAAAALRRQTAATAVVVRDDTRRTIAARELVVGDLVLLSAGAEVPADLLLLRADHLHLQQAALTGEPLPVPKTAVAQAPLQRDDPHAPGLLLAGSAVVSGHATAVVVATGAATAFGWMALQLDSQRASGEFERGSAQFGLFIMKTVVALVAFVLPVVVLRHGDPLEAVLFTVALAVGLTPEFLPMITTVTLARAAVGMAHDKVVVRSLSAIQRLGGVDLLCCDKTGTLTRGEMELVDHVDPFGAPSERSLFWGQLNAWFESGEPNPYDVAMRREAGLDPLDAALLRHEQPHPEGYIKIDELPLDFERRRTSVVVRRGSGSWLITKGAVEAVLAVCSSVESAAGRQPCNDEFRRDALARAEAWGRLGQRVLAVAWREHHAADRLRVQDEAELILVGFLCFFDPPRADAADTIAALSRDGIEIKVLSGDAEAVTNATCQAVGLPATERLSGDQIDSLSDVELAARLRRCGVLARLAPRQKQRIVRVLREQGRVVGFLGDGINDAPAIQAADVGLSVSSAVDVAKQAADVLLGSPDLAVLHRGIQAGRVAYANVEKYLLMGTSSSFGNMLSMAIAASFLPFLPLLPLQILLNNLLYDLAQITIPTDRVDPELLRRPRRWEIAPIRRFMLTVGPISSIFDLATFAALLWIFHADAASFQTGWFIESLVTQTLVIFVIRTAGPAWRSRPSAALGFSAFGAVAVGCWLPYSPLAHLLGFVALRGSFLLFVVAIALLYLLLTEWLKRIVLARRQRAVNGAAR